MADLKKVSAGARKSAFLRWIYGNLTCFSQEHMQTFGYLAAMLPVVDELYDTDEEQVQYLAELCTAGGVPVVQPAGGHAIYLDVDKFFGYKRGHESFCGMGLSLELIRRYGIRASELGDCGMEYDEKTPEQQAEICNVVRLAINRSQFSKQHIEYVANALIVLYRDRDQIPNMKLTFGKGIPMRHFHMWLEPYAPKKEELCDEANYAFWAEWEKDREAKLKKWGLK